MWRLARANQRFLLQAQPSRSSTMGVRRTLAATANGKKRALDKDQLLSSNKPTKASGAAEGGGTSPSTSGGPEPSSATVGGGGAAGGGGGAMPPIAMVGGLLLGGAVVWYLKGKDALDGLPWNQTESKPTKDAETTTTHKEPETKTTETTSKEDETTEATTETAAAEETGAETRGHRVVQIEVPPDMMNKSDATSRVVAEPHPEKGNRVSMDVKKEKKKKAKKQQAKKDDTRKTEEALKELQASASIEAAKTLVESHQAMWTSLGSEYFSDLDNLSKSELKTRVVQLATEIKDRTQWEAVRLKEFLALKEKETAQQHAEIIQKQRLEFEDILATRLREQDAVLNEKLKEAMSQKDASIQSAVNAALEAQQEEHNQDKEAFAVKFQNETQFELNQQYGEQMEAYKQVMEQDLKQKVATLTELSEKLQRLQFALENSQRNQQGSSQAHKLSAAALALSEVLETHSPAGKEVLALEAAAGDEGVIATAVRGLPPSVQTDGVPTLSELQTKFEENYSTCRQAALVPPGRPGLDGQLAGMVFAALKYPPKDDDPAPVENPNSAEHVLARARKQIQLGELSSAVKELENLQGQAAFVIGDWKKAATDRVQVDEAVKVIKLECALLHGSVVE